MTADVKIHKAHCKALNFDISAGSPFKDVVYVFLQSSIISINHYFNYFNNIYDNLMSVQLLSIVLNSQLLELKLNRFGGTNTSLRNL